MSAGADWDARAFLGSIPLFADVLSAEQLGALAAHAHPAFFRSGTLLMSQGELGGSMFALVDGAVEVRFTGHDGREQRVATLGPGEIVGEMSLFTGDRRTATVAAASNVNALEIGKASLERIFARSPDLLDKFAAVLAGRQAELNALDGRGGVPAKAEFARRARMFFFELFGRPGGPRA